MRLAHHLLRHPTGVWHFRLTVPADLREAIGLRVIKRSLGTHDPGTAKEWAYMLGARYAHAFGALRKQGQEMGGKNWDDDAVNEIMRGIGANAPGGVRRWEVQGPGGFMVRTDGSERDNAGGLEALKALKALYGGPLAPPVAVKRKSTAPTLADAVSLYDTVEGKNLKPNTRAQRARACTSFVAKIGAKVRVDDVTRPMAAAWTDDLQRSGLSKRYVANCVSHVAQIFEAQIQKGHISANPVKGVVVMKASEKRALREAGHEWEAFPLEALRLIFDPANLGKTRKEHVRWGALIGLYTGARVSEVAQIFLRDFEKPEGVPCVRLTNDSDGQSLKTAASKRLVPIHPDLLRLGLWERVEALRKQGEERLFPDMRIDSNAGAGNSITKGFSYYLAGLEIKKRRAKGTIGFHSLRKTVIQTLQGSPLAAERRRALVGHEPGDEDTHSVNYMRAWTAAELAEFFPGLKWGEWIDFDGLRRLLPTR